MAEEIAKAASQASSVSQIGSAAGQLVSGFLGVLASVSTWPRVAALATFLAFTLLYMGKLPLPKTDNTNALNAINSLHKELADLKAAFVIQAGEMSGQLDIIEVQTRLPPAAPPVVHKKKNLKLNPVAN